MEGHAARLLKLEPDLAVAHQQPPAYFHEVPYLEASEGSTVDPCVNNDEKASDIQGEERNVCSSFFSTRHLFPDRFP